MVQLCIASGRYDVEVHRDPNVFDLDRRAAVAAPLDAFQNLRLDPTDPAAFHYGVRSRE
jgi:hypothetical protein